MVASSLVNPLLLSFVVSAEPGKDLSLHMSINDREQDGGNRAKEQAAPVAGTLLLLLLRCHQGLEET